MSSLSPYLKAVVGVLGAVLAGLQEAFPGSHWVTLVTLALTPVLVYLVPNMPAPVKTVKDPAPVSEPEPAGM